MWVGGGLMAPPSSPRPPETRLNPSYTVQDDALIRTEEHSSGGVEM